MCSAGLGSAPLNWTPRLQIRSQNRNARAGPRRQAHQQCREQQCPRSHFHRAPPHAHYMRAPPASECQFAAGCRGSDTHLQSNRDTKTCAPATPERTKAHGHVDVVAAGAACLRAPLIACFVSFHAVTSHSLSPWWPKGLGASAAVQALEGSQLALKQYACSTAVHFLSQPLTAAHTAALLRSHLVKGSSVGTKHRAAELRSSA